MGFGPIGDPQQSLNDLVGKMENPYVDKVYAAKDYTKGDLRRDLVAIIKALVEILGRDP